MALSVPWAGDLTTYGPVYQDFGPTNFGAEPAGYGYPHFHRGLDFELPCGTPVLAPADGTVSFAGWDSTGYGNKVAVQHSDGTTSFVAHLSRIDVTVDQGVYRGNQLGLSGTTGNSTGCHLHFGVMIGNLDVNPWDYLAGGSVYNHRPDSYGQGASNPYVTSPGGSAANLSNTPGASPIVDYPTVIIWARQAGIPESQLATAAAIAMAESTLKMTAINKNGPTKGCPNGSTDWGLWQINDCYHPQYDTNRLISDGVYNAQAMADVSKRGTDWSPWSSYPKRSSAYMSDASAAVAKTPPGTQVSLPAYASGPATDVTGLVSQIDVPLDNVSVTPNLGPDQYIITPVRVNSSGLTTFPRRQSVMLAWIHEGYIPLDSGSCTVPTYFKAGSFNVSTSIEWLRRANNSVIFEALLARRPTQVVILAGYVENTLDTFTPEQLVPIFTGLMEAPEFDYNGSVETFTLTGPDLSGVFSAAGSTVNDPTASTYMNQDTSAVVKSIVTKHNPHGRNGLKAIIAKTQTKAGDSFGANNTASVSQGSTEWDFLQSLAATEGFVCWMDGTTLRFQPLPQPGDPAILEYAMNNRQATYVSRVHVKPQPHSKRDYQIILTSYNTDTQQTLQSVAGNVKSSNSLTLPQKKNIPQNKLDQMAKSELAKFAATEVLVDITIEGIIPLGAGQPVHIHSDRLHPSFTAHPYYPVSIQYDYKQGSGLTMTVSCTSRPWGVQTTDALGGGAGTLGF